MFEIKVTDMITEMQMSIETARFTIMQVVDKHQLGSKDQGDIFDLIPSDCVPRHSDLSPAGRSLYEWLNDRDETGQFLSISLDYLKKTNELLSELDELASRIIEAKRSEAVKTA